MKISSLISNQFFTGSLLMVVGSNLYNFGQFVFHFLTGRFLGKVYYGDLAAIISLLGIVTIVQLAFNLTIVRFIASEKKDQVISNFIKWVYKWSIWVAVLVAILVFISSPLIASFLHLAEPLSIYLLSPLLLFFIITTTGRSILQGLLMFDKYVVSLLVEAVIKIILVVVLFFIGWAIFGAVASLLISIVAAFLVVRFFIGRYLKGQINSRPKILPLLKYSFFVFLQGLALTSMYSVDLILVKHFFPATSAGIYASLAVLGRIIFFGASPVTHVMFPLVAKRYHAGESYYKIFFFSLSLVMIISLIVLTFYLFFPHLAIGLLFGSDFLEGSNLLWWFALFMTLLAVAMLLSQFYLSIGKTKIIFSFVLAALLQVVLIWFIHPDLLTVIQLSIVSAALLNLILFVYFIYLLVKR